MGSVPSAKRVSSSRGLDSCSDWLVEISQTRRNLSPQYLTRLTIIFPLKQKPSLIISMTIDSIRQQTIRCHLRQKNIGLALKVFLSIPNVETHSHALLEAILRDWYLAGLLETQTLLEFFSELPDAQWTLDGLEIVYTLIEMLSQAGDFRAMV